MKGHDMTLMSWFKRSKEYASEPKKDNKDNFTMTDYNGDGYRYLISPVGDFGFIVTEHVRSKNDGRIFQAKYRENILEKRKGFYHDWYNEYLDRVVIFSNKHDARKVIDEDIAYKDNFKERCEERRRKDLDHAIRNPPEWYP